VAAGPFAKLLEVEAPEAVSTGPRNDDEWVQELVDAPYERFRIDDAGRILDGDVLLGQLVRGVDLLRPEVALRLDDGTGTDSLGAGARSRLQRRLVAWARDLVGQLLAPLRQPAVAQLSSDARGLVYQLEQGLGTIHRSSAEAQLRRLVRRDRALLHSFGVEIGARLIWLPKLLRGPAPRMRAILIDAALPRGVHIEIPRPGAVALVPNPEIDPGAYTALGYPVFGTRALRADIVERLYTELARLRDAAGPEFELPAQLAALAGVRRDELPELVSALGQSRR
jgi:ATP-dependent RNA helicase SUPV3L1/SUV3